MFGKKKAPEPTQTDRKQLDSPEEIEELVHRFYDVVGRDDLLGPMFNDVAAVDWPAHLKKMTGFWCRNLLGMKGGYEGNPFRAHSLINEKSPFTLPHFERWLKLWSQTIYEHWEGPLADQALEHAQKIGLMHSRQFAKQA